MSPKQSSPTDRPKRRRTKAERDEHAHYARLSFARKKAEGLVRAHLWIFADDKAYFERLAEASRNRRLAKRDTPVDKLSPKKIKRATKGKIFDDPRQQKLPF